MMDQGYTSERAKSGLNAASALVVGAPPGERKQWVRREEYWREQLEYARRAGR